MHKSLSISNIGAVAAVVALIAGLLFRLEFLETLKAAVLLPWSQSTHQSLLIAVMTIGTTWIVFPVMLAVSCWAVSERFVRMNRR